MVENLKNAVDIPDIKSEVFEVVLKFIYAGDVNDLERFAEELFVAADKYELMELKSKCEDVMADELSPRNACQFLVLADQHFSVKLKMTAIQYINANKKNLMRRQSWKKFESSYPKLLAELYDDIMSKESAVVTDISFD